MYDYNASLAAVEETMTMLEHYRAELNDLRAASTFALTDLQAAVDEEVNRCTAELETLWMREDNPDKVYEIAQRLRRKLETLEAFQSRCCPEAARLLAEWNRRCGECDRLATNGRADAGRYLQKLNGVVNVFASNAAEAPARTIILDSDRYPQTAEHIRAAIKQGHPEVVTLDRSGAAARRTDAMGDKPSRSDFDRDEYPCAMFAEGGEGSDVAYIAAQDNRGSGSNLQWQVRTLPDGTRVRIRII